MSFLEESRGVLIYKRFAFRPNKGSWDVYTAPFPLSIRIETEDYRGSGTVASLQDRILISYFVGGDPIRRRRVGMTDVFIKVGLSDSPKFAAADLDGA